MRLTVPTVASGSLRTTDRRREGGVEQEKEYEFGTGERSMVVDGRERYRPGGSGARYMWSGREVGMY